VNDIPPACSSSASFVEGNPAIELWHGRRQRFGQGGVPQRWVNLLGTVHGGDGGRPVRLTCSVNAGRAEPLSLGPDGLRLREAGDFNAEIPIDMLKPGDNAVRLEARDDRGRTTVADAIIQWQPGRVWPLPWTVDWTTCPDSDAIADHVQIVDGRWRRTPDGIRPVVAAYDRLVTIGDMTWRDYRVRVAATIHGFEPHPKDPTRLMGGLGILVRWTGHHHDEHQPHREWRPNGAIAWYRTDWEHGSRIRQFNISDAVVQDVALVASEPHTLAPDEPVLFDFTVRSQSGRPSVYHFRAHPAADPGRLLCDLTTDGRDGEAPRGSVLLIALRCDVTIHSLRVDPV
jgi:hypothetical protein